MPLVRFHARWVWLVLPFFAAPCFAQSADPPKRNEAVAVVAGETIFESDLLPSVRAQLIKLQSQEYDLKRKALDTVIEQKLLEQAARTKGIPPEKLLEQDVDAKIPEPTDIELQAYYLGQKEKINRPFDEVKGQLQAGLRRAKIQEARKGYLHGLLKDGNVTVLLAPPKVQVGYDPQRLRGNPKAPVVIVEFSDFQCPYCRQAEEALQQVLTKYGDRVSLAYRDFPIVQLHPQAELAAEASRCAGEQGKFWEYHDRLFNSPKLDRAALLEHARTLRLDEARFDSCLASGKYTADIQSDIQAGTQAGVSGTPAFFVNGTPLSGAQSAEKLARIIDQQLAP